MHFDFRPLLRRTFAKIFLSAAIISTGRIKGKANTRGLGALALAKPHFWKLGCCIWGLFLEASESNVRQYQRQIQGCASRPWYWLRRSLSFGSSAAPYAGKCKCALPFSCLTPGRQEVVALNKLYMHTILWNNNDSYSNFRETFANKKVDFRKLAKNKNKQKYFRAGSQHNIKGLRN